jgi:hypothetical protein
MHVHKMIGLGAGMTYSRLQTRTQVYKNIIVNKGFIWANWMMASGESISKKLKADCVG